MNGTVHCLVAATTCGVCSHSSGERANSRSSACNCLRITSVGRATSQTWANSSSPWSRGKEGLVAYDIQCQYIFRDISRGVDDVVGRCQAQFAAVLAAGFQHLPIGLYRCTGEPCCRSQASVSIAPHCAINCRMSAAASQVSAKANCHWRSGIRWTWRPCSQPGRGKARLSGNVRSADDIDSIANAVTSKYLNLHETATSNSTDSSGSTSSVFSRPLTKVWIVSSQETLEHLFQSASNNR
ncbi:Uncharacterised protein [Pseudomonas aeruginosa]|nr:Uncharacterised protein [Pseudomonas aeruginosa]